MLRGLLVSFRVAVAMLLMMVVCQVGCSNDPPVSQVVPGDLVTPDELPETQDPPITDVEPTEGEAPDKPTDNSVDSVEIEPSNNDGHSKKHENLLANETSPYLLLHAHNPVNWYPWGEEALAKAKKENKMIFLSVGYSSCHWCHVMERESFVDEEIAKFLNDHYVCIKVDREERPDIDNIYMTAVNLVTQRGGWPMSVFMTPDAKPFFGGTYFPARDDDRPGHTGFLTVIGKIQELWKEQPDTLAEDAERLTEAVKMQLDGRRPRSLTPLDANHLVNVQATLAEQYDEQFGGFGYSPANPARPKFPEPSNLFFLLDRLQRNSSDDEEAQQARNMLIGTLEGMAMGGIRDHLGGGFHRYSVDRFWHIPHFEKMLYDNGQLATVYAEAHLLTGRDDFRRIVDEMLGFVLRELTGDNGGFLSALDAESEDEEGKYYRWEKEEVEKLVTPDEFELFASVYGLDDEPNFEEHFYAPQFSKPLAESAEALNTTEPELDARLAPIRKKLLAERDKRKRPLTDTKILTSWNGLMIRGFADAGRTLKNQDYIDAAGRAANFVLTNLRNDEGRLLRTHSQGEAKLNAYLNDYAFMIDGLIALHRATEEQKWLDEADALMKTQIKLFWDEKNTGFYFTSSDHESLLARGKNPVDGAQPSGNSVSAENLVYLGRELKNDEYLKLAGETIQSSSGVLENSPAAAPRMAVALAAWLDLQPAVEPEPDAPDDESTKPDAPKDEPKPADAKDDQPKVDDAQPSEPNAPSDPKSEK